MQKCVIDLFCLKIQRIKLWRNKIYLFSVSEL
jgi:hypothetical protein